MPGSTNEWAKVLTHPLGLVGYVLFLLFGLFARVKLRHERRWILPAALLAAGITLVAGIGLAYRDVAAQVHEPAVLLPPSPSLGTLRQQNQQIRQQSRGNNSPNIQGVQGDVSVTYDLGSSQEEQNRHHGRRQAQ